MAQGRELWAPVAALSTSRAALSTSIAALSTSVAVHPIRVKRALDAVAAVALLVVLAPLLVAVAVAVGLSSPGPVLFRQRRVGRGGAEFQLIKFRTMHRHAERQLHAVPDLHRSYVACGYKLPLGSDPRVTTVGALLRRFDLDELPQLWNVLRGHMSLVGPRPVPAAELTRYGRHRCYYEAVRPGMTGLWQVSGRNRLPYDQRIALDVHYVQRLGLGRDVAILARTLPALMRGGGSPWSGEAWLGWSGNDLRCGRDGAEPPPT